MRSQALGIFERFWLCALGYRANSSNVIYTMTFENAFYKHFYSCHGLSELAIQFVWDF